MDGSGGAPSNDELLRELDELRRRVEAIERTLHSSADSLARPEETAQSEPVAARIDEVPVLKTTSGIPLRTGQPSRLESRIGAQLFNRVGIFAVLAGSAWFLKLAIDRAWIGAGLRVSLGLLLSFLLLLWSERFRRESVAFSCTLKALAAGLAYLSLWACFNLYHLLPAWTVFLGMTAVTVGNALLAWRQDSELLAALALAGGLATPALLATGGDPETFLFSYLLLLDIGAMALSTARPWSRLILGAFAGTTGYFIFWWARYYVASGETLTGVFVALFFAVFTAAPFFALRRSLPTAVAPRATLPRGFPLAVGVFAFLESYRLLSPASAVAGGASIAVALGVTYLALVILARATRADRESLVGGFRVVHLGLAVGFFALFGLLKFDGYGIPLCWLLELALLAGVAVRFNAHSLGSALRGNTAALLLLSFFALLLLTEYDPQPTGTSAFFNAHFATYLAGLVVFAGVVVAGRKLPPGISLAPSRRLTAEGRVFLAGAALIAFNLTALLAVGLQIHLFWLEHLPRVRHGFSLARHPAYVGFTYSAWFMLYGGLLMAAGFLRRSAFVRWQALVLLTLSIGKVFLFDISQLNEGYRVGSFLALGVLLLAISFVYQRDWLGLRGGMAGTTGQD